MRPAEVRRLAAADARAQVQAWEDFERAGCPAPMEVAVEQGTQAWLELRAGIPTASAFGRVVTPSGRASAQAETYRAELLAEWALGVDVGEVWTEAMERGRVLEPDAFAFYALQADADPAQAGFVFRDVSRMVGCSPDGWVGSDGLIELKCPTAPKHLLYLAAGGVPAAYRAQVQGQLWVTGREWCDFMSYYPGLPPHLIRVHPDRAYQAALDTHIPRFIDELLEGRERLRQLGVHGSQETSA